MPDPNGVEIAQMYVGFKGIQPQGKDEPNRAFRNRVAQVLRTETMIVDAHEVQSNRYHDEPDPSNEVRKGIMGAAALGLAGHQIDSTAMDRGAYDVMEKIEAERNPAYADAMMMLVMAMGGR